MAKLHINIGDVANDRTGDPLRTAFEKVNANFDELYSTASSQVQSDWNAVSGLGVILNKPEIPTTGDFVFATRTISSTTQGNVILKAIGPGSPPSAPPIEYNWAFTTGGRFQLPVGGDIVDSTGASVLTPADSTLRTNIPGTISTVIHTASSAYTGYKLVITVEGILDGDVTSTRHTQTCEATIAAIYNSTVEPVISVYGVVYTSPTPLATFTVRRGLGNIIEVLALNSQALETLHASVHAIKFVSYYD